MLSAMTWMGMVRWMMLRMQQPIRTAFPLATDAVVLSPPSGVTFAGYELRNDLDFKNGLYEYS